MNQVTHISTLRSQYSYNRSQVLWLTGISLEAYTSYQFEMGLDWLSDYTGSDRHLLNDLMHQELIWRWWVNEWNRIDDLYILNRIYQHKPGERLAQYRALHQSVFIKNIPPYSLLEQSYAKAVNDFQDELKRKA